MNMLLISELVTTSCITFVFYILLSSFTPKETTILKIFKYMPLKECEKKLGYYLPQVCSIIIATVSLMSFIYIPAMFANLINIFVILNFIICIFIQSFVATGFIIILDNFINYFLSKTMLPYQGNIKIITVVVLLGIYIFDYMKAYSDTLLNYQNFKYEILHIAYAFFLFKNNTMKINYGLLLLFLFVMCVCFVISINFKSESDKSKVLCLFKFLRFSKHNLWSLCVKELKNLYRNEENIVMYFCIGLCIAFLRVKTGVTTDNKFVIYMLGPVCSLFSISAFSLDRHMLGIYIGMGISKMEHIISKILGLFLGSIILYTIFIMILFNGKIDITAMLIGVLILQVSTLVLFFLGVMFPTNSENPFSQGIVGIICIMMSIPIFYIGDRILKIGGIIAIGIIIVIEVGCFIGIFFRMSELWENSYEE